ncbi:hypothetical protein DB346_17155 [Verrucomicrobia bacterium LW23]|nr:hypothetical protein DB346_17155 [Verrucomicrobia bacterium LW23]
MSSDSFYDSALARGLLLKEQGRYAEAENYFRRALSVDPENGEALNLLAGCQLQQGQSGDALVTITDAIAREPNESDYHALQAVILSVLDRPRDATAAAMRGLALQPTSLYALNALTQTYLSQKQWARAEESSRRALALDADDALAANFLALSLRMQNKWDENEEQIRGLLSRNPEDAFTHSNAGWAALTRGDSKAAEAHFRESLRLDPDNDSARDGLLQSFKGRSWLYRRYLDYCFFMEKFSGRAQIAMVVGLMIAVNLLSSVLTGPYKVLGALVLLAYLAYVFFSHVAHVVGNIFLLTDRFARYVLTAAEKREAAAVGLALALGTALTISAFVLPGSVLTVTTATATPALEELAPTLGSTIRGYLASEAVKSEAGTGGLVLLAGVLLAGCAIPLCHVFTNNSRIGTGAFTAIAGAAVLSAVLCLSAALLHAPAISFVLPLAITSLIILVLSTWLTNVSALRR